MDGFISINGQITPPDKALISPLDRGFLFGDNIFEVFVAINNKVLDMTEHLSRLRKSASMIRLKIPWSNDQLAFEIDTLAEAARFKKAYIRLVITRGLGNGLTIPQNTVPTKIIYCLKAHPIPPKAYREGITLKSLTLSHTDPGAHPKTGNYLTSITALDDAIAEGYDDILMVNANGEITESSTANIFLLGRVGDLVEIATPHKDSGLLLGITRQRIIQLLHKSQIPVTIRKISIDEIPTFDEAFVCSTVKGLVPITKIDQHRLYSKRRNSVFNHIERLFLTWVESEIGFRVDWNSGEATS